MKDLKSLIAKDDHRSKRTGERRKERNAHHGGCYCFDSMLIWALFNNDKFEAILLMTWENAKIMLYQKKKKILKIAYIV